jgi:hypothetical protein
VALTNTFNCGFQDNPQTTSKSPGGTKHAKANMQNMDDLSQIAVVETPTARMGTRPSYCPPKADFKPKSVYDE